jgi:hypothetical protein
MLIGYKLVRNGKGFEGNELLSKLEEMLINILKLKKSSKVSLPRVSRPFPLFQLSYSNTALDF